MLENNDNDIPERGRVESLLRPPLIPPLLTTTTTMKTTILILLSETETGDNDGNGDIANCRNCLEDNKYIKYDMLDNIKRNNLIDDNGTQ